MERPQCVIDFRTVIRCSENCHIKIELLWTQIWNSFGLVETFPFDILLGSDYLCYTPFLTDPPDGPLMNPELKFDLKTHVQLIQTTSIPFTTRVHCDVPNQGPERTTIEFMTEGTEVVCVSKNNCSITGSGVTKISSGLENAPLVATRKVSKGRASLGRVAGFSAIHPIPMPVKSELTNTVQVGNDGLLYSSKSRVQASDERDDNDFVRAPSDKILRDSKGPTRQLQSILKAQNLSPHLESSERARLLASLREFPEVFPSPGPELGCNNVIEH